MATMPETPRLVLNEATRNLLNSLQGFVLSASARGTSELVALRLDPGAIKPNAPEVLTDLDGVLEASEETPSDATPLEIALVPRNTPPSVRQYLCYLLDALIAHPGVADNQVLRTSLSFRGLESYLRFLEELGVLLGHLAQAASPADVARAEAEATLRELAVLLVAAVKDRGTPVYHEAMRWSADFDRRLADALLLLYGPPPSPTAPAAAPSINLAAQDDAA